MDMIKRFEPVSLLLLVIGGLNWAILALFSENVVSNIFGSGTLTDVIYTLVGVAALTFVPRVLDSLMHFGDNYVHPTRA